MTRPPPTGVLDQLRALSHELRFEIIRHLAQGERCVCDLETLLDLPQSRISYHLGILRDTQLVTAEQRGKNMYYTLQLAPVFALGGNLLTELFPQTPGGPSPAQTHQKKSVC
ncbi:hypothetical protein GCM10008959_34300 [Deinococcus seoulensis]|uniref:HTH arsR-type domain-containing protein n=1 Tax=Deinococcus seoulensis TaxID=1837379 RepID=A0ABQ2RWK2_9DEIO|nr:metalloregulator ArsR/SmtB family transcription factor [Deinococcus seoulensis]GGR69404.1 hypothetical protein GCM10008959_34300 [Deinococcus seoulensis]